MNSTPAPALVITDTMRRRHYAALSAAETAYQARQAPAREHKGMTGTARRTVLALTAQARMWASNR